MQTATASGDFQGLIRRLDYLQGMGVTALWLMPFQTSPGRDDGYDVSRLLLRSIPDMAPSATSSSSRAAASSAACASSSTS